MFHRYRMLLDAKGPRSVDDRDLGKPLSTIMAGRTWMSSRRWSGVIGTILGSVNCRRSANSGLRLGLARQGRGAQRHGRVDGVSQATAILPDW